MVMNYVSLNQCRKDICSVILIIEHRYSIRASGKRAPQFRYHDIFIAVFVEIGVSNAR